MTLGGAPRGHPGRRGLLPLPSRWIIEFGEPIDTTDYDPEDADDPMLIFELVDRVRDTIQQMLYRNLMERGPAFQGLVSMPIASWNSSAPTIATSSSASTMVVAGRMRSR